jgi:hypothetical protein
VTLFQVELSNGLSIEWEYMCSLGSPRPGAAEKGVIRAQFMNDHTICPSEGFGLSVGEAIVDLLRTQRNRFS